MMEVKKMESIESRITRLIAIDNLNIPISSMSGKLDRKKGNIAEEIDISRYGNDFMGERVYARIDTDTKNKARTLNEGINAFEAEYPRYGQILRGMIAEKRASKVTKLYFGVNEGSRLTTEDYLGVMKDLGFSEKVAYQMYPELMTISRSMKKKRDEERSILL